MENLSNKNLLVFYSNTNSANMSDATGAFIPEAKSFAKFHKVPDKNLIGMDLISMNNRDKRRKVLSSISKSKENFLDGLFFFGHGWPSGMQFGFNLSNVSDLANAISDNGINDIKICFYACLTAENKIRDKDYDNVGIGTDGGFADVFRDCLAKCGLSKAWVDAHKTAGHAVFNPFLVRFLCEDVIRVDEGAIGGAWIVQPRSQMWHKWTEALKGENNPIRYRFPFMTELEIKNELETRA